MNVTVMRMQFFSSYNQQLNLVFSENAKVVRTMDGREGHWAFIYPRGVLRMEYHPGHSGARDDTYIKGTYGDGFTLE